MTDQVFKVVVNEEAQYSVYPASMDLPPGWFEVGVEGSREECLAHIEEVWTDIRPLSVRQATGEDVDVPEAVERARADSSGNPRDD